MSPGLLCWIWLLEFVVVLVFAFCWLVLLTALLPGFCLLLLLVLLELLVFVGVLDLLRGLSLMQLLMSLDNFCLPLFPYAPSFCFPLPEVACSFYDCGVIWTAGIDVVFFTATSASPF